MTAPVLVTDRAELPFARATARGPVTVVMTMGALHDGHAELLQAARAEGGTVFATIFVNPLQFGPAEDFDRYPRTLDADLAVCREAGVDVVFAPDRAEMYPGGDPAVRIDPGPAGAVLEGATRPGHFAGVLTVVHKLLQLTRADVALFGEKDYQQLTLIRAMVRDLDLPVRIVPMPTVREADGLARSSRNRYLSPAQRAAALALPRALAAGSVAGRRGASPADVLAEAAQVIAAEPGLRLDYLALTDPELRPLAPAVGTDAGEVVPVPTDGRPRLLGAVWAGETRLIDNQEIRLRRDPDPDSAARGEA